MVGANMAFHDAICECFEGTMLEPCLLKPCFHVAGDNRTGQIHKNINLKTAMFDKIELSSKAIRTSKLSKT